MDNKNHNPDREADGTTSTIPLTAVPGKFGSPQLNKRLDQNQADLDFDYTTPNIPYPSEEMKSHPVSSKVNSADNEGEELIERVDAEVGTTPSLF